MLRSLPRSREFLQQNDFIELKGYNKVGENTFPNIMVRWYGMLKGIFSFLFPPYQFAVASNPVYFSPPKFRPALGAWDWTSITRAGPTNP